MMTWEEVEIGLGTDNIQVISAELTKVVVVGQGQDKGLVLTETELDALSQGNMIISLKNVQICKQKRTRTNTTNELFEENRTALKVLGTDMYDNLIRKLSADDTIVDHTNL